MKQKVAHDMRILVSKRGPGATTGRPPRAINHVVSGNVLQHRGEGGNSDSKEWEGQPVKIGPTLEVVRFFHDGRVRVGTSTVPGTEAVAGIVLKPFVHHQNCVMTVRQFSDPSSDNGFDYTRFRSRKGTAWETYIPPRQPLKNRIRHRDLIADQQLWVETEIPLPRDVEFEIELDFMGVAQDQTKEPGVRLSWGNNAYSMTWRKLFGRYDNKPCLERWVNGGWQVWKRFDECPPITFRGRDLVTVRFMAGRACVFINGHGWHLMNVKPATIPGQPDEVSEVSWPAGRMSLSTFGVDVMLGLAILKNRDRDGRPATGSYTIEEIHNDPPYTETRTAYNRGYETPGTKVVTTSSTDGNTITTTTQLTADPNGKAPFVTSMTAYYPGIDPVDDWIELDIRPAALRLEYDSGKSDRCPMATCSILLDRDLLDKEVGSDWPDYVQQFAQVRVEDRWRYIDDETGEESEDEFEEFFKGLILDPDKDLQGFGSRGLRLIARDMSCRYREPAGIILPERYQALDGFLQTQQDVYGSDGIKRIITTEQGTAVAATLNGNGNGQRFFNSHYPLLSRRRPGYFTAQAIPLQSSFYLPPPFDRPAMEWMETLAGYDHAILFWGYINGVCVPIYGRVINIMAFLGNTPLVLPDAVYDPGDENNIIAQAQIRHLSDRSFNEVVVTGKRPDSGVELTPSYFRARSRLASSDINSSERSHARTLVIQQDFIGTVTGTGFAQELANETMRQFEGVIPSDGSLTMPRGDSRIKWGSIIQPRMSKASPATGEISDQNLGLNGKKFRIKNVRHVKDFMLSDPVRSFTTELIFRPLSSSGF